jgi:hypothetical protein
MGSTAMMEDKVSGKWTSTPLEGSGDEGGVSWSTDISLALPLVSCCTTASGPSFLGREAGSGVKEDMLTGCWDARTAKTAEQRWLGIIFYYYLRTAALSYPPRDGMATSQAVGIEYTDMIYHEPRTIDNAILLRGKLHGQTALKHYIAHLSIA